MILVTALLAVVIAGAIWARHIEVKEWRRERAELLNRIQHPEIIVQPASVPQEPDEVPVDLQDDKELWALRGHVD